MKRLSSLLKIPVSAYFVIFSLTSSGVIPDRISAGAGEAGMGFVCIMKNGFWSSFHNQAILAYCNTLSVGINYENRFNIAELGTRSAGITIPSGKASLGAVYSHFGYADFKRDMTGIACGLKLSNKIYAGIQVDYFSERASGEYNNNQSVTCEAGFMVLPVENIRLAFHLFNPVPKSIRKTFMPTTLRIGAGTELNKTLFAGAEVEMSYGKKPLIRTGFEYEAAKKIWIRGGFCTANSSFSFGLGYLTKIVMVDFGFFSHEMLGITSSVSLVFKIH